MSAPARKLLGRHRVFPRELFRVSAQPAIRLRDRAQAVARGGRAYDLEVDADGLVQPRPGPLMLGPNGASLRPNTHTAQEVIRGFRGRNTTIYRVPEGTALPDELVLLHEHTDQFSLQCTAPMTLPALNKQSTAFFTAHAERLDLGTNASRSNRARPNSVRAHRPTMPSSGLRV